MKLSSMMRIFFTIMNINALVLAFRRFHIANVCSTVCHSSPQISSIDFEMFQERQWELYAKYQSGDWRGIQTGYDPEDDDVADHMYIDSNLKLSEDGESVLQTNSIVMSEVRADCEVCFDSTKIRTKEVGTFSKFNLKSRHIENIELKGPGSTPRGVSYEVSFRHEKNRLRVLVAFEPYDWNEVDNIPISMALRDVVITREGLDSKPINDDSKPHSLWTSVDKFQQIYSTKSTTSTNSRQYSRVQLRNDLQGNTITTAVESTAVLPRCQCLPGVEVEDVSLHDTPVTNSIDSGIYSRIFPGGVKVEVPILVTAKDLFRVRTSWAPYDTELKDSRIVYACECAVTIIDSVTVMADGRTRVSPPALRDFFVEKFEMLI